MPSANALRIQIEHSLERRFPSALTPVPCTVRETAATGITEVDRLLDGGLPVGAISELTGPESSGRTSLALAFLGERTRDGLVCAWVDADDAFDAESAAASGVNLRLLLLFWTWAALLLSTAIGFRWQPGSVSDRRPIACVVPSWSWDKRHSLSPARLWCWNVPHCSRGQRARRF